MLIEVVKITVVRRSAGMDCILLELNIPDSTNADVNNVAIVYVARYAGLSYCEEHLPGVPVELIDTSDKY